MGHKDFPGDFVSRLRGGMFTVSKTANYYFLSTAHFNLSDFFYFLNKLSLVRKNSISHRVEKGKEDSPNGLKF